jgi:hypothetical protein
VPHPNSDAERWQAMVQAPFMANSQTSKQAEVIHDLLS